MQHPPFYIVANWKSNKTISAASVWLENFQALVQKNPPNWEVIKVIVCPAFIHLGLFTEKLTSAKIPVQVGSQDISSFSEGAYTGDIAATMLSGCVSYTLIGHSERRKYHKETPPLLAQKVSAAVATKIKPIYCVQNASEEIPQGCDIVAYEPVWAIGTGQPDTPENSNYVASQIKKNNPDMIVCYGGSVTAKNIDTYIHTDHIGGVLVGGASLKPEDFVELLHAACTT